MKTTHHRSSTPGWCWAIAGFVALICLPGAGTIVAQRATSSDTDPAITASKDVYNAAVNQDTQEEEPRNLIGKAVDSDAVLTGQLVIDEPLAAVDLYAVQHGAQAAEREIEKALQTKIDVRLMEAPLSEALATLTQSSGVNVFIEKTALTAKGLTPDTPVTLNLRKPISLKSALNLVLQPLELTHTIENEVLKITGVRDDPQQLLHQTLAMTQASKASSSIENSNNKNSNTETVPLSMLRKTPEKVVKLVPGDILAVFVEGILGEPEQLPPVNLSDDGGAPSVGFPIPVREDGTLPLPFVDPIKVGGLTVTEAQKAIVRAYTIEKELLQPDEARILVSLVRQRHIRVLVFRQDVAMNSTDIYASKGDTQASVKRRGYEIELPHDNADLLSVLAQTGGLPGPEADNEIRIYRPRGDTSDASLLKPVRVPFKVPRGTLPEIAEEDITLHDGDIVVVPRR